MKITAHIGETRDGLPLCELRENGKVIAKMYPNEAGTKFRVVLPDLKSFRQTRIDIDSHLIEFERKGG